MYKVEIMLYLVATPIGNLGDVTLRALETLRSVDRILCEDTRHSGHFLRHHGVSAPLSSYHKFNEAEKEEWIIQELREGKNIALISDAGTPLVADPGERLVRRCKEEGLSVTALPGPAACIVALTLSGFSAERFQFLGFLSKKPAQDIEGLLDYSGTTIFYESPHRIVKSLTLFGELAPARRLCIARELTKTFEEILTGTSQELLTHFQQHPPRGEFVLLVEGAPLRIASDSTPQEDLLYLQSRFNITTQEAIRLIAQFRNLPKREVYQAIHNLGIISNL